MKKGILFKIPLWFTFLAVISACKAPAHFPPSAAEQPAPIPVKEGQTISTPNMRLPKMVLVDEGSQNTLIFYDLAGQAQSTIDTPGLTFSGASHVHVAGSVPASEITAPVVYLTYEQQEALLLNINNEISRLALTPQFFQMSGAAAEPVFAYSLVQVEELGLRSTLHIGNLTATPYTRPLYSWMDDEGFFTLLPLRVLAQNGNALGVWYTHSAWGIGGDIIYPINRGLFYYDLTTDGNWQFLDDSRNPQGISPDTGWVASVQFNTEDSSLRVENLRDGYTVQFPLHVNSERGAGYAFFSADNQYVAWVESSGWTMAAESTYHSRIRVGQTNGDIIQDLSDAQIAQAIGYSLVSFMKPVGWLDNQTLLIEARQMDWQQATLLKIDVLSGAVSEFCIGTFAALVYE